MKKILTAEDDKEINRLICEYLSSQGYETLSALVSVKYSASSPPVSKMV